MPVQSAQVSPLMNFIPIIFIFVIFYFMLILPQKRKEKEHRTMLANLKKNDEVVTTGGIHGTVVNVKETTVVMRVDENVKFEIEKSCVAYVKGQQTAAQNK